MHQHPAHVFASTFGSSQHRGSKIGLGKLLFLLNRGTDSTPIDDHSLVSGLFWKRSQHVSTPEWPLRFERFNHSRALTEALGNPLPQEFCGEPSGKGHVLTLFWPRGSFMCTLMCRHNWLWRCVGLELYGLQYCTQTHVFQGLLFWALPSVLEDTLEHLAVSQNLRYRWKGSVSIPRRLWISANETL